MRIPRFPFHNCLLCAMLFVASAAGTNAYGSCGDYLHHADHASTPSEANEAEAKLAGTQQPKTMPPHWPVPCNGPGCRNAPIDPTETAPPAVPRRVDSSAAFVWRSDEPPLRPEGSRGQIHARDDRHAGHARRIDRPPQPNA